MHLNYTIPALALALAVSGSVLEAAPKAAAVFSSWQDGQARFRHEFDPALKRLNASIDRYENTALDKLSGRLDHYDLVCVASTGNYEHTFNLAPYGKAWRQFVEDGGILLIADANYGSVLQYMLNTLGPEFALNAETCPTGSYSKRKNELPVNLDDPVMRFPENLLPRMDRRTHWAHFDKLPAGWIALKRCGDGCAIMAQKFFGKGMVLVTCHANFTTLDSKEALAGLVTNTVARLNLRNAGLTGAELKRPEGLAQSEFRLVLRGMESSSFRGLTCELTGKNSTGIFRLAPVFRIDPAKLEAVAETRLPRDVRGVTEYRLKVSRCGRELFTDTWVEDLPPFLNAAAMNKHLYPKDHSIRVLTELQPQGDALAGIILRSRLDNGSWQEHPVTGKKQVVEYPLEKTAEGRHVITFEALRNGKLRETREVEFFRHPEALYSVRADGVLLEKGKPFIPVGIYHVSWSDTPANRLAMLRDVAAAGYNTIHAGIIPSDTLESYRSFLDECAKLKVRVITEFTGKQRPEEVIRAFRGHPAVMGWNPGDEPAGQGITSAEMFRRYDTYKQLDPDHIAYTVICVPSEYKNYACGTDILAPDPYPIPSDPASSIYPRFCDARKEAMRYDTTIWAVLQSFGNYGNWARVPYSSELRVMSYLALLAGAKGLILYTYSDRNFRITDFPELYAGMKALPAELETVTPAVACGRFTRHLEGQDSLYSGSWEWNGKRITVVVNAGKKPAGFSVPAGSSGKAGIRIGKADNFRVSGGKLSGSLGAMDRIVIEE